MKGRVLKTWFWDDDTVQSVSKDARFLWVFILTNKELGMTNYVRIPDTILKFYLSLTEHELKKAKEEIQATGKVFFYNNWIFIPKLEKQNNYRN